MGRGLTTAPPPTPLPWNLRRSRAGWGVLGPTLPWCSLRILSGPFRIGCYGQGYRGIHDDIPRPGRGAAVAAAHGSVGPLLRGSPERVSPPWSFDSVFFEAMGSRFERIVLEKLELRMVRAPLAE